MIKNKTKDGEGMIDRDKNQRTLVFILRLPTGSLLLNCKRCHKTFFMLQDLKVLRSRSLRGALEGHISTTYLCTLKSTRPV